ncbi:MAG: T9SS type A sorting domain-containing protein, partial [Bacteroidetes bacterium]|nr:T9SS type A sorting domain-containing protein [Bacteroidota bacterium]
SGAATIAASDLDNGSSDACGIASMSVSPSSFDCSKVGPNTVTLTVTDNNGNSSTATATVTVNDVTKPVASAKNISVSLDASGAATIAASDVDNGSSDACGIASMSVSPSNFDCSKVGANTVTLTVTDNNGNSSTATAIVTVKDVTAPVVKVKNINIALTNQTASISASDVADVSTDNCGIVSSVLSGKTTFGCADRGKTFDVTLTQKDQAGNTNSAIAKVTVTGSTIAPSISTYWKGLGDGNYFIPYHSEKVKFTTTTQTGYTYSWSGNDISGTKNGSAIDVQPSAEGKLVLTATAKGTDGCEAQSTATLCVFNVAVPNTNNSKVYVCHGKNPNSKSASGNLTLEISISGAVDHLTSHSTDAIGKCTSNFVCSSLSTRSRIEESTLSGELVEMGNNDLLVYPNPSKDIFYLELEGAWTNNSPKAVVTDLMGRTVETHVLNPHVGLEVGRALTPGVYTLTVLSGDVSKSIRIIKQ